MTGFTIPAARRDPEFRLFGGGRRRSAWFGPPEIGQSFTK